MSLNGKIKDAELTFFKALGDYVTAVSEDTARKTVAKIFADQKEAVSATPVVRWVYFIQGVDGGPVKIGVANDPVKRLAELQRTSPSTLRILATEEGGELRERALHRQFADWRLHGEWFAVNDDLASYIDELSSERVA